VAGARFCAQEGQPACNSKPTSSPSSGLRAEYAERFSGEPERVRAGLRVSMMNSRCPGVVLMGALALSITASAQERVRNAPAGIEIAPPAGWHETSLAQVQANRENVRMADADLQHAIQTRSALPLLVFTKYPEPHEGLNPSIQVTLRSAIQGTPTDLLSAALEPMRRAFPDFRLVSPVHQTWVSGWSAAALEATYTLRSKAGGAFPVRSRMWLVPRGRLMFLIAMSGSVSGADVADAEFKAVLDSIVIQK